MLVGAGLDNFGYVYPNNTKEITELKTEINKLI